jgi:hypothetical protein
MTRDQLVQALQKFPNVDLYISTGEKRLPLDHVEMAVDNTPQVVEGGQMAASWQELLATKLQVTLVGHPPKPLASPEDQLRALTKEQAQR